MKQTFTIGEISTLFGVGPDSIRYYEKLGVIRPARAANGYRVYSIGDVWRLNVIRDLRGLGVSMQRIKKYLARRSVGHTLELLAEEGAAVDAQLARLRRRRENLAKREQLIRDAIAREKGVVRLRHIATRRCYQIEEPYSGDAEMDVLMQRLLKRDLKHLYLLGSNRFGSRIPLKAARAGNYNAYSGVFAINSGGDTALRGGDYLCVSYHGGGKNNREYLPQLLKQAAEMDLQPAGDILELILVDVHVAEDETEHILELQMPVEKAGGALKA